MKETFEQRRWVGRVLRDRWRIDERLSRGGVGTVYAATHKNNGSRAAIKVLHPEFARDADTRSRFLQEGYAANQVNHPGVVRILDDDTTDDGHSFLVMELLEGELLEKRRTRKGGKLPLVEVFEVGDQLLDVLAAAHEKDIVHRDIKPENLFITREGRLKVLDFGFAQMKSGFRKEQTATGFLLGTPGFMSPEQAVGNRAEIDAKTDIWAVGATLFTLLSGEPVHDGNSAAEMLVAAANFPPRSLASVQGGLPPKLVDLVDRAVAFDKHDRWANARAMQQALKDIAARASSGTGDPRPRTYSIPDREPIHDEPTLYTGGGDENTDVEELASENLVAHESIAQPPAPSDNERTLMAPANQKLPVGAIPSEITKSNPGKIQVPRPAAGRPATSSARPAPAAGSVRPAVGSVRPAAGRPPAPSVPDRGAASPVSVPPSITKPPPVSVAPASSPTVTERPVPPRPPPAPPSTRPASQRHAADEDDPTLAKPSLYDSSGLDSDNLPTTTDAEAFKTAPNPKFTYGSIESDPSRDGGTLIMEPAHSQGPRDVDPAAFGSTLLQPPSTAPYSGNMYPPVSAQPGYPSVEPAEPPIPRAMRTGANATAPPQTSRVLVFIGVAIVTMVVVIVAGLLVLNFSD